MSITIRPATYDDYAATAAIAREVHIMHATAVPAVFRQDDAPLPLNYYRYLVGGTAGADGAGGAVYVAEREGAVVGYVVLETQRGFVHADGTRHHTARVEQIGVMRAARGRGAGRALMDAAIAWAKARHADALTLLVWEFNTDAIAFYEHLGLRTESRTMALSIGSRE